MAGPLGKPRAQCKCLVKLVTCVLLASPCGQSCGDCTSGPGSVKNRAAVGAEPGFWVDTRPSDRSLTVLSCCRFIQRSLDFSCALYPKISGTLFSFPKMHSPTFLLILSITFRALPVLSLAYPGPKPTDASSSLPNSIGWNPKPTTAPFAESPLELLRRSEAPLNTCGWFDGNAAYPFTCTNGYACSADSAAAYFGCCETDASGNYLAADCAYIATGVTACYDYTDASYCTGACYSQNRVWYVWSFSAAPPFAFKISPLLSRFFVRFWR